MGANKHSLLKNVVQHTNGCIVEIGSGWSSTPFLEQVCEVNQMSFYTVDIQPYYTGLNIKKENHFQMTGEEFMKNVFPSFNKVIVGAYLDNFDWTYDIANMQNEQWVMQQYNEYKNRGVFLSNYESSLTHLRQVKEIVKYCIPGSLIVFDDTWISVDYEVFMGKGNAAIYYLLTEGWSLIDPISQELIDTDNRSTIRHIVSTTSCLHFLLRKN